MFSKTLGDVQEQVAGDDRGKWDAISRCQTITLHQGRLISPETGDNGFDTGLAMTPWATSQACQQLGIPAGYFKKCPINLQDAQFNYWNRNREIDRQMGRPESAPDETWMLRCKAGSLRGVLSPKYAKLDNRQLMEALLPLLAGTKYEVALVQLNAEAFHLRLIDPHISRDVLPNDRLLVGIHVANSEVGLRAVTIDALVFRVVCLNGLIRRINSKSLMKQRHIHVAEPKFAQMLERAVGEAVMVAAGFIEQMALAVRTPVPDPTLAIELLGQMWNLPKSTQEHIRFALLSEPLTSQQDTLYGLTNAVTGAAQRLGMEERFELETLAGMLVDTSQTNPSLHSLRARILSGAK